MLANKSILFDVSIKQIKFNNLKLNVKLNEMLEGAFL